jgi:L-2-hydroxyglutarate oxidase
MIDSDEINSYEPEIRGIRAIRVPSAGIIDYVKVNRHLAGQIKRINNRSALFLQTEVLSVNNTGSKSILKTSQGEFIAPQVIFCTGLQSDRMAKMERVDTGMRIVGFRGDYYKFTRRSQHKVKTLVYPVPDPKYPFLGVHFTKMIDGSVECGPNAVFSFAREGYSKTAFNMRDTVEGLSYRGTWRLFAKHLMKGLDEYKRAFSKRLFLKELRKMMPGLQDTDVIPGKSGIRAQAIDPSGAMVDDFVIKRSGNNIHVLNAPSPAATACLSIADEIVKEV